jgi:chemotaxis protein methyltransferase CheR
MERRAEKGWNPEEPGLKEKDFSRLSGFIESTTGIRIPESKKTMLEARLQRRLRSLRLYSFDEYCAYLFSKKGMREESIHMIDAVATNKTDFFREPEHFDYLTDRVLPELLQLYGLGIRKTLKVWSAGCSTGEEAYTLAMVLSEFAGACPGFSFSVLATDISTKALEIARTGVYEEQSAEPIPLEVRRRYLLRSKERSLVKIAPEIRRLVDFRRVNLMDEEYGMHEVHVIFCRNVIIYFNRHTQILLLRRLCRRLARGGYILMGHSETLHGMPLPLIPVAAAIYRKTDEGFP